MGLAYLPDRTRVCKDRGMGLGGVVLVGIGLVVVFMNVVATRRLWASPIFEASQKVAQTILMWLIPGGVFVVWSVLREPRIGSPRDATAGGATFVVDWLMSSRASGGHHGSDGGHHGGGDGGGHHADFGGGGHGGGGEGGGGFGGHGGGHP